MDGDAGKTCRTVSLTALGRGLVVVVALSLACAGAAAGAEAGAQTAQAPPALLAAPPDQLSNESLPLGRLAADSAAAAGRNDGGGQVIQANAAPLGQAANGDGVAGHWAVRTVVSLAGVLALVFLLKLVMQKASGRSGSLRAQLGAGGRSPSGVIDVLARYPLARGQTLVLVRLDRRILLICQTSQGMTTLSEVKEPEAVASLISKTIDEDGMSLRRQFETMMIELEQDPAVVAAECGRDWEHGGGEQKRSHSRAIAEAMSRLGEVRA